MGLEIAKGYFLYSFHAISGNCYKDIAYHGRKQASITFLDDWGRLRKVDMRVNGEILKLAII